LPDALAKSETNASLSKGYDVPVHIERDNALVVVLAHHRQANAGAIATWTTFSVLSGEELK